MKTQKFEVEITDKTDQFPVDAKAIQQLLDDSLGVAYIVSVNDVTWRE